MSLRAVERMMWVAIIAFAIIAILGWRRGSVGLRTGSASAVIKRSLPVGTPSLINPPLGLPAVKAIADGNLFRRDRHSPATDVAPVSAPPSVPSPPKPRLVLRGMLGGPPWDVLLDGVPGRAGTAVARVGDTIGGLVLRNVQRDTLVIRGVDTTWKLTIGRP